MRIIGIVFGLLGLLGMEVHAQRTACEDGEFAFDQIPASLMGTWVYQYSCLGDTTVVLPYDRECPTARMVFRMCADAGDMRDMPPTVANMRKGNVMENISCTTYLGGGERVDVYYPVILDPQEGMVDKTMIYTYGRRMKGDLMVDFVSRDSLVIYNNRVWEVAGRRESQVRHVYLRSE